jgi:Lrp/AsnC family leucine-responsive transcriptional regulator
MLDVTDELILSALSKNAKQDLNEIRDYLNDYGYNLNTGEIETRIKTLEGEKVISGYTISIDANKVKHKLMRVVLVTFRSSQHLTTRMKVLKRFSDDAPFVLFSGRTRGGYDWITILLSSSTENADEESDIYRNLFGDIIQDFEIYDFYPANVSNSNAFTYTSKEYTKFLGEWLQPTKSDGINKEKI